MFWVWLSRINAIVFLLCLIAASIFGWHPPQQYVALVAFYGAAVGASGAAQRELNQLKQENEQ